MKSIIKLVIDDSGKKHRVYEILTNRGTSSEKKINTILYKYNGRLINCYSPEIAIEFDSAEDEILFLLDYP